MEKPYGILPPLQVLKKPVPKAVGFELPVSPIESSKLHDEETEAVIKFSEQEKQKRNSFEMGKHDPLVLQSQRSSLSNWLWLSLWKKGFQEHRTLQQVLLRVLQWTQV